MLRATKQNIDSALASFTYDADLCPIGIGTIGAQLSRANGGIANESCSLDAVANRTDQRINSRTGPLSYDSNHCLIAG